MFRTWEEMATPEEGSSSASGTEKTDGGEGNSRYRGESNGAFKALSQQRTVVPLEHLQPKPSNWESVLRSLKLFVDGKSFPEVMVIDGVTGDCGMRPCYNLDDLWTSLNKTSIYGAEVPLVWGEHSVVQYFSPTLSGIQLYVDSEDPQTWLWACEKRRNAESPRKDNTGGSTDAGVDEEPVTPVLSLSNTEAKSSRKADTGGSGANKEPVSSILSSSTAEAESSRKSDIGGSSGSGADKEPVISVLSSCITKIESSRKSDTGGSRGDGADKEADTPVISLPTAKAESSRKIQTSGSSGRGANKESYTYVRKSSIAETESSRKTHTSGSSDHGANKVSYAYVRKSSIAEAESSRKTHTGEAEADSSSKIRTSGIIDSAGKESDTSSVISLLTTEVEASRKIQTADFEAYKDPGSPSVISSFTVEGEGHNSQGTLLLQHLDAQLPFNRLPLTDQITLIYTTFGRPEITTLTSIDLHPSSWIAVAWYPSYKVPSGLTLKDLDTAFLTFHFLSTRAKCNPPHEVHPVPAQNERPPENPLRLYLPIFGLASFKIQGSVVAPSEPHEVAQEETLLFAAEDLYNVIRRGTHGKAYIDDFDTFNGS